jgi:hypothetical protein
MLAQSLASMVVAWECLRKYKPDVFIDTTGYGTAEALKHCLPPYVRYCSTQVCLHLHRCQAACWLCRGYLHPLPYHYIRDAVEGARAAADLQQRPSHRRQRLGHVD